MYFWETILAIVGLPVVFLSAALCIAISIYTWSPANRYGPKGNPWKVGTFEWCWEMGVKIVASVVFIPLYAIIIWGLYLIFFEPFIRTFI